MKRFTILFFTVLFTTFTYGQDTFSICAIDTITGQVGSAGASCVYISGAGVRILSDVHPGVGVIHTQAWYRQGNQNYARGLMNQGIPPQQIIDSLVANDEQDNPSLRQYGIVDFRGGSVRTAAYTGVNTDDYKNHIIGPNYTIQGNILLGQQILDSMESRFLNAEGDLACRLMAALQGAKVVGADTRCMSDGISSIGTFLRVANPEDEVDNLYLDINIPIAEDGVDPIDSLQVIIDQWGGCAFTNVQNNKAASSVKTYPNPADKFVTFEFDSGMQSNNIEMAIYNSQGKVVYQIFNFSLQEFTWNTSSEKPGIYFYNVMNEGMILASGKIIVK